MKDQDGPKLGNNREGVAHMWKLVHMCHISGVYILEVMATFHIRVSNWKFGRQEISPLSLNTLLASTLVRARTLVLSQVIILSSHPTLVKSFGDVHTIVSIEEA